MKPSQRWGKMNEKGLEISINTPLDDSVYHELRKIKKRGKFGSWKECFHWLITNKNIQATIKKELKKPIQTQTQPKTEHTNKK
jgi:hypothetical protein